MEGHAKKCQFKEEENGSVGEISTVCPQIVLKRLYLARIGRPDILCSVNKFARAVTKWTKACDKRLARLIAYHWGEKIAKLKLFHFELIFC